jgi:deoxyribodipyrimidine photolyase
MKLTTVKPTVFESFNEPDNVSMEALRRKEKAIEYEMEQLDDTMAKAKVLLWNIGSPEQQEELQAFVKANHTRYEILRQKRDVIHDSIISLKKLK